MSDIVIFRMDAVYTGTIVKLGLVVPGEAHALGVPTMRLAASRANWEPGASTEAAAELAATAQDLIGRFEHQLRVAWAGDTPPMF